MVAPASEVLVTRAVAEVDKTLAKAKVRSDSLRDRIIVFLLCVISRQARVGLGLLHKENFGW